MTAKVRASILLLVLGTIITGVALASSGCGSGLPGDAVAQIGETLITRQQLDQNMADIAKQYQMEVPDKDKEPDQYKQFESGVLRYLVDLETVRQKAAELKVAVTEEDIQEQIDQIKQMFGGDETKFEEAVAAEGMTVEQLRKNITDNLLLSRAKTEVTKDLTVSDEEIKAYYEANKPDFKQEETRKARHILFKPKAPGASEPSAEPSEADWASAKALADKVRSEIQNGASFADEAKKYSDDAATKEIGGELQAVPRKKMVAPFDEALFSLEKGKLSEPIRTIYGYHLIEVLEINEAKQFTLDEVKDQIKNRLLTEKKNTVWREWLDKVQAELKVAYAEGMEPTTTTTTEPASTTSSGAETTAPGESTTTSKSDSTTSTSE